MTETRTTGRLRDTRRLFGTSSSPDEAVHPLAEAPLGMQFYDLLSGVLRSKTNSVVDLARAMGAREPILFFQYDSTPHKSSTQYAGDFALPELDSALFARHQAVTFEGIMSTQMLVDFLELTSLRFIMPFIRLCLRYIDLRHPMVQAPSPATLNFPRSH